MLQHVQRALNREGIVDSCLLILHDWSYYITLDGDEIDDERGVIMEELRTRNNAGCGVPRKLSGPTCTETPAMRTVTS